MATLRTVGGLVILAFLAGCGNNMSPYRQENHGTFEEEFAPHEGVHGWWYITGYASDVEDPSRLYAFQYTQLCVNEIPLVPVYSLQLNLTDMTTGQDLFEGSIRPGDTTVYAGGQEVAFGTSSRLTRTADGMDFFGQLDGAEMNLHFDLGKGAVWHGDNGVLVMGTPEDPVQRTVYYSYTNMPTTGQISIVNEAGETVNVQVKGKAWLDRQWGPYRLTDTQSFWEWFSLRFFDEEEVMLFAFPQHDYYDGTYVRADGGSERLQSYTYDPTDYVEKDGTCYSFGWDLVLPGVKEKHYRIEPMLDDQHQFHWNYFELMARVVNDDDELVGYAFVELLPGLRDGECGP